MSNNEKNVKELAMGEMGRIAGGAAKEGHCHSRDEICPNNPNGHNWVKTGHHESEWFSWLKDGGLFSIGYDHFRCTCCRQTKVVHVPQG